MVKSSMSSSSTTSSSSLPLSDPDDSSITITKKKKSGSAAMLRRSSRHTKSKSTPIFSSPSNNTKSTNSTSSSSSNNNNNNDDDDDMILLKKWIHHDDHSYHLDFLSPTQSYKIRMALVEWYRANRRKLPWRGDGGPYDGSTAGFASKTTTPSKKSKRKEEGKDIRSFFGTDASSNKRKRKLGEGKEVSISKVSKAKGKKDGYSSVEDDAQALMLNPSREVTAYGVWVSEIMLQQTRVEAVIPYYLKWMQTFPTVHDLAAATEEEVNAHWAGLGFYRRARLLHAGAKRVVNEYDGIVPNTVDELMKLEGIGRYTASAVGSIAYGVEVPVVDGNVCRVLSRLTGIANHIKAGVMKDDLGWALADRIIKAKSSSGEDEIENIEVCYESIGSPGEVNQALMELGATYCSPSGSGVDDGDPLKDFYVSTRLGVAIGRAMTDSRMRGHVENLIAKKAFAANDEGKCCRLCDPNGISTAYYNIMDQMNDDSSTSDSKTNEKKTYAIAGHASLPIPPPKKSKREEVIAVAVISSRPPSGEERCWLMVKRPPKGLLAGQWEFPSVCVWNSAEDDGNGGPKKKKKGEKSPKKSAVVEVPLVDPVVRSNALDSLLSDIFPSDGDIDDLPSAIVLSKRLQVKDAPVVHIFSHVCHTMWIEYGEFEADEGHPSLRSKKWKVGNGQEIGWMTESDMASVGITSGVRKVMAKASTSRRKKSR